MRGNFRKFLAITLLTLSAFVVLSTALSFSAYAEGKRVALVVGNGAYQNVAALPNPRHDAELVSTALRKQGFEVVTAIDLTRVELEKAVERYVRSLNGADISLFYYSGHGLEVGGENRIVPIDANLNEPQDLETQTFSLQTIMLYMQSNSKAQLIYLDACRNNPFSEKKFLVGVEEDETKAGKGLAEQKGGIGSLIAYAAAPGQEALDGSGANSPFTEAVMRHSFTQGLDVQSALMKVTEEVWQATNQQQRPWVNSTLVKPVFLNGLFVKTFAANVPELKQNFSQLQSVTPAHEVFVGPFTRGVGPQDAYVADVVSSLSKADGYKLMQMPQSGTLYAAGQILSEGMVLDLEGLKALQYEPSTDSTLASATLAIAAIARNGSALPISIILQQIVDECDLAAGEALDLQGVGKGLELQEIDGLHALDACLKAAASYPATPRFVYQLGRAKLAVGEEQEALRLFQSAAEAGHIRSLNQLGDMAFRGLGRAKNAADANAFYKQAADKGDPFGMLSYGRNLVKGIGLNADPKQGIAFLKRAAEMGNSDALDEMGSLYLYGGAVKANPKRAVRFYEASITRGVKKSKRRKSVAFAGHPTAATDIGALYFNGKGVDKNLRQAIKWYELGAERGNQGGAADLSWIFAQGPDDLRNPTRAAWYTSLALATDGFRGNADLLRRLATLPDDAKRNAMRDFVDLVGPCSTQTSDSIDDTLLLLSNKAWLQRQSDEGDLALPENDNSFSLPDGKTAADELRYWNLVNAENQDQAYLAYLQHFPDGIFADIARGRLGGLLERVKLEPKLEQCEPPAPLKIRPQKKKAEPLKLKQETPKIRKVKPKPPPIIQKPRPIIQQPKRKIPPRIKRPRPPRVVEEDIPVLDPVIEDQPQPDEPDVEIPRRKKFKIRIPRIKFPRQENTCPNNDC